MSDGRPVVAILVGHYLPGSKGGGPIRSVANLVQALGDEFDFRILTLDRDLGDDAPFSDVPRDVWTPVGRAQVRYLSPEHATAAGISDTLLELDPDLVYCQSYFSPLFSIGVRWLRRSGKLRAPLLVAPRGEFSRGALEIKRAKKRVFLTLGRIIGLDRGVIWHATAETEARDLCRVIGKRADIIVAPPLPTPDGRSLAARTKRPGELDVVFLSRISPKKNLLGAIEILRGIDGVRFTVYGPKEDPAYWERCVALAQATDVRMIDGGSLEPEEVRPAFERGHLFLFPTFGENYGHVVMEALSAGTPVLTSDQTPWRDLQEAGAGWDFGLADLDAYRKVIQRMVRVEDTEFRAVSRAAWGYARHVQETSGAIEKNRSLLRSALEL